MVVALSVAFLLAVGACIGWFARGGSSPAQDRGRARSKYADPFDANSDEEIEGALRRMHVLQFEDASKASRFRAAK